MSPWSIVFFAGGAAFSAVETFGVGSYLYDQQGAWDYVCLVGVLCVAVAPATPSLARQLAADGRKVFSLWAWLAFFVGLGIIVACALDRMGAPLDAANGARVKQDRALTLATDAHDEAKRQLKTDTDKADEECAGKGQFGKLCRDAKAAQEKTQQRLDAARAALAVAPAPASWPLSVRLIAHVTGSPESAAIVIPAALPLLAFSLSSIFFALAGAKRQAEMAPVQQQVQLAAAPVEAPRPAPARRGSNDVAAFAQECMRPAKGASAELAALYPSYARWCESRGAKPLTEVTFTQLFAGLCELAGFTIIKDSGRAKCLNLEIAG
jgi:hypothetical protein